MKNQETRLYKKEIDIDTKKVKEFWNKRAEKYSEEDPYKSIKCNDKNKDYVDKCDEYEKNIIFLNCNNKLNYPMF